MDKATRGIIQELILNRPWSPEEAEANPTQQENSREPACADCRHLHTGMCRKHHIEVHPKWPACDSFSPTPES